MEKNADDGEYMDHIYGDLCHSSGDSGRILGGMEQRSSYEIGRAHV
jgi:hypothetical protein